MTDYGHDLLLGVVLRADSRHPHRVLDLAVAADRAGLDVVAVPDHPYDPRTMDVWTVLAAVAARTASVRLVPDVLNLPLRPPAGLARTAAALDLLSGGRVELGLGAGGYPRAIADEGGPLRTARESLDALREAVGIVRALLARGDGPVTLEGRHHHVRGATPGPPHPHPVGLWLGTVGPRALRLTGEVADGWLPSATRVPPSALAAAHRLVDDAAEAAGRDPRDIRRLYNVPAPHALGARHGAGAFAEQLAGLTLEHGTSGFFCFTDDPAVVRTLGREVAPRVRDLVAAGRA